MPTSLKRSFLFVALVAVCGNLVAAGQLPEGDPKNPDHSQESFVIEQMVTTVDFENDGTSFYRSSVRTAVQSEAGVHQLGQLMFQYQRSNQTLTIDYVRVRKPDGSVVETPLDGIQDLSSDITRAAPMYTDLSEKHVPVQGLNSGDVLEYQISIRTHTPLVPGQFWFQYDFTRNSIILEEELRISVPRDRRLIVKSDEVDPVVVDETKRRTYLWKSRNVEVKSAEEEKRDAPAVGKYPAPPVQLTTFQTWEEVGRWYGELQQEQSRPTAAIRAKAAELTRDASGETEKLQAIYNYVATRFRYVSVSLGIGRYQPHAASEVLRNQFGDCKDKHTLLAALLEAVGLRAFPALINSTRLVNEEVPSPGQFDHVISAVPVADGFLWLDSTLEVTPFRLLVANLRDKFVLVSARDSSVKVTKTPADPPWRPFFEFDVEGTLNEEGTFEGHAQVHVRGDSELGLRVAFRRTPQSQWKDLVQSLSYNWGFGGTVSEISVSSLDSTDEPLQLSYTYTREEYGDWKEKRIPLPFPRLLLPGVEDEEEKKDPEPVDLGTPTDFVYTARVSLTGEFNPRLPKDKHLEETFADYSSTYSFSKGVLQAERRLISKVQKVPPEQRKDYKDFREAVAGNVNTMISLDPEAFSEVGRTESQEAWKLYEDGRKAMQERNIRKGLALFREALDVDPNFGAAWLALGVAQMGMGDSYQGIEALRKAVEVSPRQVMAYKVLAFAFMSTGRREEAIQTWKNLRKVDPEDGDAAANLGSLLNQMERYDEAVTELEAAVKINPRSPAMHFLLGQSYLLAGRKEDALLRYEEAAKLDPDAEMLNNAAYVLAEEEIGLSLALEFAKQAVEDIEKRTADLTLETLGGGESLMSSLTAYWDTLGWVHYRLGNLEQSEQYLSAAWALGQSGVTGEHLGRVYEKQGMKTKANQAFKLALGDSRLPRAMRERLEKRLGGASAAEKLANKAREELSQLRTVKLSGVVYKKGSAEFYVFFPGAENQVQVKFASGDDELKDASELLAGATFESVFPESSGAKLLRRGLLYCPGNKGTCTFVFLPLRSRPRPNSFPQRVF